MRLQIARCFVYLLASILTTGCSAQSPAAANPSTTSSLDRQIQNQIRNQLSVPPIVDITLGQIKASNVSDYDTLPVTLSNSERKVELEFLISKDRKTLARLDKFALGEDPGSKIDLNGRPVRGNRDAKVTIINYDDFQCPFCARMHESLMTDVLKAYGDKVRIIYKDFPLVSIHPWATRAAVNANCLNEQNNDAYWDYADFVHANQREIIGDKRPMPEQFSALDKATTEQASKHGLNASKLNACIKAQDDRAVKASMAEATKFGVDSTPTMFVNGEEIAGALPIEVLRAVLDRALKAEGITPPEPVKANPVPAPSVLPGKK